MVQVGGNLIHGCTACGQCFEKKDGRCVIDQDPVNDWIAKAQEVPGSWWTDWSDWLKTHAGKQIAAPKTYGKGTKFKAIEAAPGRYVKAKA